MMRISSRFGRLWFLLVFFYSLIIPVYLQAQDRNIQVNEVYPPSMFKENGGKFINVKNLVAAGIYHKNAVGDGVTDDSDAIIAAMTWVQNRLKDHYVNVQPVQVHWHELWTIYLPKGTYRVTKPLVYGGGRVPDPLRLDHADREGSQKILLVGQSRENTIIKLDNNASGFQSGGYKAVVAFSRFDLSPPTIFNNMPSGNQIRNITIDTGTGNLNAIGLDFCGANTSRLDNIKVEGSGRIGIHMRTGTTAGYQSNVTVEGFDYGIYMEGYSVNHSVFEYVTLVNQNISAVYLTIASASIRKLRSTNSVTGVLIEKTSSLTPHLVITDSEFTGGGSSARVFNISDGHLFARNINVGGYGITVSKNGTTVNSGSIQEYASDNITTYSNDRVRSSAIKSMNLPVEEYPIVPWESNHSNWANVHDYGAIGDGTTDDMAAIQTAMNSGKPVVYFPKMRYNTSGKITIPSTVKQVIGSNVQILGSGDKFDVSQASSNVLLFYYINLRNGGVVRHTAQRDILLESTHSHGNVYVSELTQKGSKLFVNNGLGFVRNSGVLKNIDVWVRWNNNEKHAHYQFNVGPGCNFWMMGFKSEGTYSVFDVQGGSLLEVLGGVMSRFGSIPPDAPVIAIRNSSSNISIIANTQGPDRDWAPIIQDVQGGTTKSWQMNAFPIRNSEQNIVIPLYASYNPALIPNPYHLLVSPVAEGSYKLADNILLKALPVYSDSIIKVLFYVGNELIGEDSEKPYAIEWSASSEGYYNFSSVMVGLSDTLFSDSTLVNIYNPVLANIDIINNDTLMRCGDSIMISFATFDQFGRPIETSVDYSLTGGGIISATGRFVSDSTTGGFSVFVTSGSIKDSLLIYVYTPIVQKIDVIPDSFSIRYNTLQPFIAKVYDQYMNEMEYDVDWSISGNGGTISENIFTSGNIGGSCYVVAKIDHLSDSSNIIILPSLQNISHDIGSVCAKGNVESKGDTLRIEAGGKDIWEQNDEFYYTYHLIGRIGTISIKVDNLEAQHEWTKLGLMMREKPTDNSKYAYMIYAGHTKFAFQSRHQEGGASTNHSEIPSQQPVWLKISRYENKFTGYYSFDGVNFNTFYSAEIAMNDTIMAGVAFTSHNDCVLSRASLSQFHSFNGFDPVKISGLNINEDTIKIFVNENINLTAEIQPENAFNKILTWNSDNSTITSVDQAGKVIGISLGQTFIRVISNDMAQKDSILIIVEIVLNQPDITTDHNLMVYPNPAKEYLLISFENPEKGDLTLYIYNSRGNLVYKQMYLDPSDNEFKISTRNFENGVYLIRMVIGEQVYFSKFVNIK